MSDLIESNYKIKIINTPLYKLNTVNNISSNKKKNKNIMQNVFVKKLNLNSIFKIVTH